ncbi:MAG: AbrB/MazE/SpoVT family DNA-binding domain-containing protein [Chloroflexi bacterium]|nr:AbrB/MazE/SpoVT family DNA-binding domain-containing protein [Chloroflexota bacterium]
MAHAKIGQRYTVVIPKEIREGLKVHDLVELVRRDDGVIELRPQRLIDASQAWFWTDTWQEGEREVDVHVAGGRIAVYDSFEAFAGALRARPAAEKPAAAGPSPE